MPTYVTEDHTLDWRTCQICYPLEIMFLLLLYPKFRDSYLASVAEQAVAQLRRHVSFCRMPLNKSHPAVKRFGNVL